MKGRSVCLGMLVPHQQPKANTCFLSRCTLQASTADFLQVNLAPKMRLSLHPLFSLHLTNHLESMEHQEVVQASQPLQHCSVVIFLTDSSTELRKFQKCQLPAQCPEAVANWPACSWSFLQSLACREGRQGCTSCRKESQEMRMPDQSQTHGPYLFGSPAWSSALSIMEVTVYLLLGCFCISSGPSAPNVGEQQEDGKQSCTCCTSECRQDCEAAIGRTRQLQPHCFVRVNGYVKSSLCFSTSECQCHTCLLLAFVPQLSE